MNLPKPIFQGFIYSMGTSEDLKCVKGVSYFKLNNEQGKTGLGKFIDPQFSIYLMLVNLQSSFIPSFPYPKS